MLGWSYRLALSEPGKRLLSHLCLVRWRQQRTRQLLNKGHGAQQVSQFRNARVTGKAAFDCVLAGFDGLQAPTQNFAVSSILAGLAFNRVRHLSVDSADNTHRACIKYG